MSVTTGYKITQIGDSTAVVYPDGAVYISGGSLSSNCTVDVCPIVLSVYGYRPTLPGSISLIALFALCSLIQIFLGFRYRTWGFMIAMVLGCIAEIIGYIGRVLYYYNPWEQPGFIIQIVMITLAPIYFSAAIYVMIYMIINYIDPKVSRVNARVFYWFFIVCDIISLILQAVGGAMSSTSNGESQVGVNIALAGLVFQIVTLFFFVVAVADYAWRARHRVAEYGLNKNFKIFATALGAATILIWLRCCYRVYELSEGYSRDSHALRDEPLFIALESVPIIVAAYALIIAHPGPVFYRGRPGPAEQHLKNGHGHQEGKLMQSTPPESISYQGGITVMSSK